MSNLKQFWEMGAAYITKRKLATGESPTMAIQPGSAEWNSWETYFLSRYGELPLVWRMVLRNQSPSFTVPARYPELFDESYREPSIPPRNPYAERPEPGPEERARVNAGFARLKVDLAKISQSMKRELARPAHEEKAFREKEEREAARAAARAAGQVHIEPFDAASVSPSPALLSLLGKDSVEAAE